MKAKPKKRNFTVYTQPACQPCRMTKKILNDLGVEFEELPAAEHLDVFEDLDAEKMAPLIVVTEPWGENSLIIDFWNGLRPDKIKEYA